MSALAAGVEHTVIGELASVGVGKRCDRLRIVVLTAGKTLTLGSSAGSAGGSENGYPSSAYMTARGKGLGVAISAFFTVVDILTFFVTGRGNNGFLVGVTVLGNVCSASAALNLGYGVISAVFAVKLQPV